MGEPLLTVTGVSKSFHTRDRSVQALADVSFSVSAGEFVTVIGPSGSGKSTLFNIIAGLATADTGTIGGAGNDDSAPPVAYMPQRDLLFPWRRVIDNATLPLLASGMKKEEARRTVAENVEAFGLRGFEHAFPSELSGGMRQRAALLRTVSSGSDLLLLDEPFGALDALTRRQMQDWLLEINQKLNRTVLFITHDVDEAVYLADRVIVLSSRPGTVQRILEIPLERPRNQQMTARTVFGGSVATLLADLGIGAGTR